MYPEGKDPMSQSVYHDEIKSAILDQMSEKKPLRPKDIKGAMETIKNQYLWNSKVASDEISKIMTHVKNNWRSLMEQSKRVTKSAEFMNFRRYQV